MDDSKFSVHTAQDVRGRWLEVDEIRLISDLRIMHSKVNELYQIVQWLRERNPAANITKYADTAALEQDIERVDDIYLWFVGLKDRP